MANLGVVDDPEIDLRIDQPRAGTQSVTFGDPYWTRTAFEFRYPQSVPFWSKVYGILLGIPEIYGKCNFCTTETFG